MLQFSGKGLIPQAACEDFLGPWVEQVQRAFSLAVLGCVNTYSPKPKRLYRRLFRFCWVIQAMESRAVRLSWILATASSIL